MKARIQAIDSYDEESQSYGIYLLVDAAELDASDMIDGDEVEIVHKPTGKDANASTSKAFETWFATRGEAAECPLVKNALRGAFMAGTESHFLSVAAAALLENGNLPIGVVSNVEADKTD